MSPGFVGQFSGIVSSLKQIFFGNPKKKIIKNIPASWPHPHM